MSRGTALVTGAGMRIGRAIALRLAREGYDIAVHCRSSRADADDVVQQIKASGGTALVVQGDLAKAGDVARLVPEAAALGPVTLLVNNASLFRPDSADAPDLELFSEHMDVNIGAPVMLSAAMAQALPMDRRGAIVHILDQRVMKPTPLFFSYALSKAALAAATITMAQSFAPRIRVNAVAPGPTLANVHDGQLIFKAEAAAVPLGQGGTPDEIADAVAYLALAPSVTGQTIAVDGGQHLAWLTPDIAATMGR